MTKIVTNQPKALNGHVSDDDHFLAIVDPNDRFSKDNGDLLNTNIFKRSASCFKKIFCCNNDDDGEQEVTVGTEMDRGQIKMIPLDLGEEKETVVEKNQETNGTTTLTSQATNGMGHRPSRDSSGRVAVLVHNASTDFDVTECTEHINAGVAEHKTVIQIGEDSPPPMLTRPNVDPRTDGEDDHWRSSGEMGQRKSLPETKHRNGGSEMLNIIPAPLIPHPDIDTPIDIVENLSNGKVMNSSAKSHGNLEAPVEDENHKHSEGHDRAERHVQSESHVKSESHSNSESHGNSEAPLQAESSKHSESHGQTESHVQSESHNNSHSHHDSHVQSESHNHSEGYSHSSDTQDNNDHGTYED